MKPTRTNAPYSLGHLMHENNMLEDIYWHCTL